MVRLELGRNAGEAVDEWFGVSLLSQFLRIWHSMNL